MTNDHPPLIPEAKKLELHPHERAIVETFFVEGRQARYFSHHKNESHRAKWLDKLNHDPGLDENSVHWLDSKADVFAILKSKGAPEICYVISGSKKLDRREMRLVEALAEIETLGQGTVVGCIAGILGYYYGELGSKRRAILEKHPCDL